MHFMLTRKQCCFDISFLTTFIMRYFAFWRGYFALWTCKLCDLFLLSNVHVIWNFSKSCHLLYEIWNLKTWCCADKKKTSIVGTWINGNDVAWIMYCIIIILIVASLINNIKCNWCLVKASRHYKAMQIKTIVRRLWILHWRSRIWMAWTLYKERLKLKLYYTL